MKTPADTNFEKQWQEAFNKASVPPPPDLWNRISTDLDAGKKSKPMIVLWGLPGYVASGIAAALVLAVTGLFFYGTINTTPKGIANISTEKSDQPSAKTEIPAEASTGILEENALSEQVVSPDKMVVRNDFSKAGISNRSSGQRVQKLDILTNKSIVLTGNNNVEKFAIAIVGENENSFLKNLTDNLKRLSGHEFDAYGTRFTMNRNKLAYVESEETATEPKKVKRRSWIGLISGLSPFKPNFQSGNLNSVASDYNNGFFANENNFDVTRVSGSSNSAPGPVFGNSFVSNASTPVQQFSNGRAVNLGINAGHQLTKNLSVETGVRYLQGNANVVSNVYGFDERTGDVNAFYQDYLSNSGLKNGIVGSSETINTEYQYLMVPVQLAYKIPIARKLNAEIVAGVSGDMFLKYKLESETTAEATLDPSNSVFRALGMSGLGGVRLNYVFDEKWELSVGSAFQKALVSNFKTGTSATLRPQTLGVNYGVNYHF